MALVTADQEIDELEAAITSLGRTIDDADEASGVDLAHSMFGLPGDAVLDDLFGSCHKVLANANRTLSDARASDDPSLCAAATAQVLELHNAIRARQKGLDSVDNGLEATSTPKPTTLKEEVINILTYSTLGTVLTLASDYTALTQTVPTRALYVALIGSMGFLGSLVTQRKSEAGVDRFRCFEDGALAAIGCAAVVGVNPLFWGTATALLVGARLLASPHAKKTNS